jgi:hypothetical protein
MIRLTPAFAVMALLGAATVPLGAQSELSSFPTDGQPPIGVLAARMATRGSWTLSYRYRRAYLGGNRNGTAEVTPHNVLASFLFAPLDLTATTHTPALAFAPSERLTLTASVDLRQLSMDHVTRQNRNFTAASSGLGDATLGALFALMNGGTTRAHLSAQISIPTGSIEKTGTHPLSETTAQQPYVLQLGSGTVDLTPGVTVTGTAYAVAWGLQADATVRVGANNRGYQLGNAVETTAWVVAQPLTGFTVSGRLLARHWSKITGHDAVYPDRTLSPAVREETSGGTRVDLPLGLSYIFRKGPLMGHRLAAEWHIPLHQDLNGPQLETDWVLTVGWEKSVR